jgi:excisionase family DNA binding protein
VVIKNKDEKITVRQAAKECGRNAETIRRWIWSGKLPAEKMGNQLYIKLSDLSLCRHEKENKLFTIPVEEFISRAAELREKIRAESGNIDIGEAIRESRERRWE